MTPYYPPAPAVPSAEPWPREYQDFTIPLSPFHGAILSIPRVMTSREWAVLLHTMETMKPALVSE